MSPQNGVERQPRVSIRYPFDFSFAPFPTTPVQFVADGNARPPGGPGFTVQGTLYDKMDVNFTTPLSNTITVNLAQGLWSMGPFTQTGTANPMAAGDYLLRVTFMEAAVQRDVDEVTIQLVEDH